MRMDPSLTEPYDRWTHLYYNPITYGSTSDRILLGMGPPTSDGVLQDMDPPLIESYYRWIHL